MIIYLFIFSLRLGSKLPPGVSQPPQFAKKPWESQPKKDPWSQDQDQPVSRPLDHVPHIRNPKLRQYYLQGTPAEFHHIYMIILYYIYNLHTEDFCTFA